jgi:hypothetical protein
VLSDAVPPALLRLVARLAAPVHALTFVTRASRITSFGSHGTGVCLYEQPKEAGLTAG